MLLIKWHNQIAGVIDDIHDGHYTMEEVQYYPGFLTPPYLQQVQIVQEEAQQAAGKALPLVAS